MAMSPHTTSLTGYVRRCRINLPCVARRTVFITVASSNACARLRSSIKGPKNPVKTVEFSDLRELQSQDIASLSVDAIGKASQ